MGVPEWTLVGVTVVTLIFGLIGRLLAMKDTKQQEDINKLFDLHKQDSERLQAVELDIAKNYHSKHEIQQLLDGLKAYLNERFDHLERAQRGQAK